MDQFPGSFSNRVMAITCHRPVRLACGLRLGPAFLGRWALRFSEQDAVELQKLANPDLVSENLRIRVFGRGLRSTAAIFCLEAHTKSDYTCWRVVYKNSESGWSSGTLSTDSGIRRSKRSRQLGKSKRAEAHRQQLLKA